MLSFRKDNDLLGTLQVPVPKTRITREPRDSLMLGWGSEGVMNSWVKSLYSTAERYYLEVQEAGEMRVKSPGGTTPDKLSRR